MCENVIEILWSRRFFKADEFTIKVLNTPQNVKLFKKNNIVELIKPDGDSIVSNYAGYVDYVKIEKNSITVKGYSFAGALTHRLLVWYSTTFLQTVYANAKDLPFAATKFNFDVDETQTFASEMQFKKISDFIAKQGEESNIGLQTAIIHDTKPYVLFYARKGKNRSAEQTANAKVVFSDVYENAYDFLYTSSNTGKINTAVVYSPEQYDADKKMQVDSYVGFFSNEAITDGYNSFEKSLKISPVTRQVNLGSVENPDYWTFLDEEATERRAAAVAKTVYSAETAAFDCNLSVEKNYRKYFDVGDIVTTQNTNWDKTLHQRLVEISELYSANGDTIAAKLGKLPKTLLEIIKSEQEE